MLHFAHINNLRDKGALCRINLSRVKNPKGIWEIIMEKLGQKIASKRKDLGMTQAEFAEMMSVTRQTVSRWESGSVLPDIKKGILKSSYRFHR